MCFTAGSLPGEFRNYLVKKRYLIAIDGTQKFTTGERRADEQLHRNINGKNGKDQEPQYYVYILEAKLMFSGGLVLPLMSEFLDNTVDEVSSKQDCELKAFSRLAKRLKTEFPRLPITLLLDGLYANGPVMALCRKYNWEFMIVLKDDSLPNVWKEANGLMKLNPEQTCNRTWKGRKQTFLWTNQIQYEYGINGRMKQTVHVVVYEEVWEEVGFQGQTLIKTARHAWLSSEPLDKRNVDERCNLMARSRWGIENDILQEKRQGYQYEHIFAYDWNAMKGYHYLMHLAHLMNELVQLSIELVELVKGNGIRGFICMLRETIGGPWIDKGRIERLLTKRQQMRWVN